MFHLGMHTEMIKQPFKETKKNGQHKIQAKNILVRQDKIGKRHADGWIR